MLFVVSCYSLEGCVTESKAQQLAHRNVWMGAGVLHQDVSINNILVLEVQDDQESGETNTRRVGMLCDWELCEYKENMTRERRTTDQFVRTVFFRILKILDGLTNSAGNMGFPVSVVLALSSKAIPGVR